MGLLGLVSLLGMFIAIVPLPQSLTGRADAAAVLAVSQDMPGVTLSSSDQPPVRQVVETDAGGTPVATVYEWENVADVAAGSLFRFRYSLQHDVGTGPRP